MPEESKKSTGFATMAQAGGGKGSFAPSVSDPEDKKIAELINQAIQKYGIISGVIWGVIRIARCHPFASGGYDPLK